MIKKVLCSLSISGVLAVGAGADEWSQFRGPTGLGTLESGLPAGEGELVLEKGWVRELGSGYSAVVTDGRVLVTSFSAGEQDAVGAFDPDTGEELWRHLLEPTYKGHDGSHDGPISTPLIADGRVFALGAWGRFVALDLSTGELVWSVHLVEDLGGEKPWYGFGSSPLRVGDLVVVGASGEEGSLIAFDRATGEVRWRAGASPIHYQSPTLTKLAGRDQVVTGSLAEVFAVDPSSGELLWSYEHGGRGGRGAASLTVLPVGGDQIFIDHDDKLSALLRVSATEGGMAAEKVWEGRALINSYIPPIEVDGALYGYTTRFLSAVDPETGEELFRSREPGDGIPVAIGDRLVIVTKTGGLHLGRASRAGWEETSALDLFEKHSWSTPAYVDGRLYLRSFGELARVDLVRGGSERTAGGDTPAPIAEILAADDRGAKVRELLDRAAPPWIDGDRVTFVWVGEADDVGIGGDMIGIRAEEPMQRVDGTDLWWWSTSVPEASRFNYAFLVDFEPRLDPHNPRRVQSAIYGPDMNFARPDSIEMSWLGMPGWQSPRHLDPADESREVGQLHEHQVPFQPPTPEGAEEAPAELSLEVSIWTPPAYRTEGASYPVAYVLDAEARRTGGWVETLNHLVGESVEPIVVAFVEFPQMPPPMQLQAFREVVVPTVEREYAVRSDAPGRALVGAGGSSFAAFQLAFSDPDFTRRVAAQSLTALDFQMDLLGEAMGEVTAEELPLTIYLEWGSLDMRAVAEGWDTRRTARSFWDDLTTRGYDVEGGEVADSTDWASWRNRTDRVLETLFPVSGEATSGSAASGSPDAR